MFFQTPKFDEEVQQSKKAPKLNRDGEPMYLKWIEEDVSGLVINDPTLLLSKEVGEYPSEDDLNRTEALIGGMGWVPITDLRRYSSKPQ